MQASKMQLTDWLDDLSVRFIVNLPREELESVERICFQVEEAQWFYEDFVRPSNPNLPSLSLRQFSMKIFQHCPLFSSYGEDAHSKAFAEFLAYKTRVPVRGAILLNATLDQVILVKGWKKGASWSFPRGKINKDEKDIDCAIREVYEETGFDIRAAGLAEQEENIKFVEITMREQHMKLFVFAGVAMSTQFEPRTRKEISKIQWYKLSDLPTLKKTKQQQNPGQDSSANINKFYMVAPFLVPLKKIIASLKKEKTSTFDQDSRRISRICRQDVLSAPVDERSIVLDAVPGDMGRLMAQLRQSQQASRESNLPEVSSLSSDAPSSSLQLRRLLNIADEETLRHDISPNDNWAQENKANAMLSILRGAQLETQTPLQSLGPVSKTKLNSSSTESIQSELSSQLTYNMGHPGLSREAPSFSSHSGYTKTQVLDQDPAVNTEVLGRASGPYLKLPVIEFLHLPVAGAYSVDSNASPFQIPESIRPSIQRDTFGDIEPIVPAASRLPLPKLSQHSSTLLDLFKTTERDSQEPGAVHLRLESTGQESPEASPDISSHSNHTDDISGIQTRSSDQDLSLPKDLQLLSKRPNQQQSLLDLFRQPKNLPAESVVNPVELSAQGSPTHAMLPIKEDRKKIQIGLQIERRRSPQARGWSHKAADTSATVTGPLNVPQFDRILRRPQEDSMSKPHQSTLDSSTNRKHKKAIKILARPQSVQEKDIISNIPRPSRINQKSLRHIDQVMKHSSQATSFQPKILKRSDIVVETPAADPQELSSEQAPFSADESGCNLEGISLRKRVEEAQAHKSALLSLLGQQMDSLKIYKSQRTTPVVSPLSEKPVASELPSPLGLGTSKLRDLQDNEVIPIQEPDAVSSTADGDKEFLLGFLDGVVRKGA